MPYSATAILDALLTMPPRRTVEAPRDARGIYGLVDHQMQLRYIGSTRSTTQSFHERIHQRHRTGSEGMSHYLSHMYNTGRMWRDRLAMRDAADGLRAKELRNAFIADHCRAVWLPLPDRLDIAALERQVLALAPAEAVAWNGRAMPALDEPTELVDRTLARLGWSSESIAAVERQRHRHDASLGRIVRSRALALAPLPQGPFRFFALDVETANYSRASICQVGVAFVRPDGTIEQWDIYVDPQTESWPCTRIHGITRSMVRGAPGIGQVLALLGPVLATGPVYQHSSFDRTAIAAACRQHGLPVPSWQWRDSVTVARHAWPELRGNGGHGLESLKQHLKLDFRHHDAAEDARASAEIVLRAEALS